MKQKKVTTHKPNNSERTEKKKIGDSSLKEVTKQKKMNQTT